MTKISELPADLKDQVAIVTGASRGIGRAIAIKLASLGAAVAVNFCNSEKAALETVAEIEKLGHVAFAIKGDVGNPEEAQRIVDETKQKYGRINILVNNAGVFVGTHIKKETNENLEKVFNTNVRGTFNMTRSCVNAMDDGGAIINVSSIVSKTPSTNMSVYAMSKGAIDSFTRATALDLGSRKIRVNAVSPGYTESDMLAVGGQAFAQHGIDCSALGRLGTPEDIAETVAYLAVPRSGAWVTGSNLDCSGGVSRSY
jgi:3-oxoacyl-[acyl-carrier protein] reductase